MQTVAKFELQQAMKMGQMGVILHGVLLAGDIRPGDYVQFLLNGRPEMRQIGAVENAGHATNGRSRVDLYLTFIAPSDRIKFRPESIGRGMIDILR